MSMFGQISKTVASGSSPLVCIIVAPVLATVIAGVATWFVLAAKLDVEMASLSAQADRIATLSGRVQRIEETLSRRMANPFDRDDARALEKKLSGQMNLIHQILADRIQSLNVRLQRHQGSKPPPPPY